MTQVRPMRVRPGTFGKRCSLFLRWLDWSCEIPSYHQGRGGGGGSLPTREAIIEEENEANLPAFVGPLDPAIPEASYLWIPDA